MNQRPRRSVLYMPGANARALEKAANLNVDCLIFDMEDAVAPEEKIGARDKIQEAFKTHNYGYRERIIRINGLDTEWGEDDLKFVASTNADAILIPKVNSRNDIIEIHDALKSLGNKTLSIWVMMETPLAMLNAQDIASSAKETSLSCFVMGTNDLAKETRASFGQERFAFIPWLTQSLSAARAFGLDIIDGVYNDFKDEQGFKAECEQGRLLGMDGKTLIHPKQIELCHQAFSPTQAEIEHSHEIISAFSQPENKNKGAISLNGKMVELLHLDIARRIVATADSINNRA